MVTKIDEQVQNKILAKFSEEDIERLRL